MKKSKFEIQKQVKINIYMKNNNIFETYRIKSNISKKFEINII
jgi:hypothetical protein